LIANSAPLILDLSGGLSSSLIRCQRQSAHSAAQGTIAFAYVFYRQYQLGAKIWRLHWYRANKQQRAPRFDNVDRHWELT
jgi:hypothetical protein